MTRGTDFNMCPPTGGLRNYRKGYEDGLNRGKAELAEVLDKISAEIEEKMSHYDHFENSNTANGLRIAREIVEKHKGGTANETDN